MASYWENLSISVKREKVDDFYAARSTTSPPLPWSNFAPPFSGVNGGVKVGHWAEQNKAS
jgi:hypothetical protein